MPEEKMLCSGLIERIGEKTSRLIYKKEDLELIHEESIESHEKGLTIAVRFLMNKEYGVISSAKDIMTVGHRVVHGGRDFFDTVEIDEKVKFDIERLFSLAPLHNPANLTGIEVAEQLFPHAKQIAVFDTSFHQTMPEKAYLYALPKDMSEKYAIRNYGFHGTSHKYVSEIAQKMLNKKDSKIISLHLGNGCSVTAIENGKSLDHSLGFGPATGLIMGTRSGDIDHSILPFISKQYGISIDEIEDILNKKSGMLGLTGKTDMRDIVDAAEQGNKDCQLALSMNAYRIQKYIGAYTAAMNGLDALIFTAGIGENSAYIRNEVCKNMTYLGIEIDEFKNNRKIVSPVDISNSVSKVRIFVIPTNEELEIAKQSYNTMTN